MIVNAPIRGRAARRAPSNPHTPQTDHDLPEPESARRRWLVRLLGLAAMVATAGYLAWRFVATLHGATPWLAVPVLALEVWALASLFFYLLSLWDLDHSKPPAPVTGTGLRLAVLIPTYNEPREVLLPTIAAAVAMRLPHQTWVLDDGHREWVAELATRLGARYTTRPDGAHAKAGNINALLPRLDVDLVAVFDADHVARAEFLEHTVGYFDDPRVALVQTPQDFYNLDSFEHIRLRAGRRFGEQELFYRSMSAGRNRWNSSFWCGTNAVVRLSALREVGGVAIDTVTEDIHTTIRLHRRGWHTVYHNEVLARGLAAGDAKQYLNQRVRWGTGAMQVLRTENPAVVSGLSPAQRVSYLTTLLGWFDSWRTLAYILLPMAVLLTGAVPIAAPAITFAVLFTSVFALQRVALRALARGRAPQTHTTLFEFVRMPANLQATLTLFGSRARPFTVTAKGRQSGRRDRIRSPRLLVALTAASGLAACWYAATVAGLTPLTYQIPWVAHGAAFWLAVNAFILAAAIRRIRHQRFGAERRAAVRFDLTDPVYVDDTVCRLRDISLSGLRVDAPGGMLGTDRCVRVRLDLGGGTFALPAVVRSVGRGPWATAGLEFADLTPEDEAVLALALFRTGNAPTVVPGDLPTSDTEAAGALM